LMISATVRCKTPLPRQMCAKSSIERL
jgi:hypothetical protein